MIKKFFRWVNLIIDYVPRPSTNLELDEFKFNSLVDTSITYDTNILIQQCKDVDKENILCNHKDLTGLDYT